MHVYTFGERSNGNTGGKWNLTFYWPSNDVCQAIDERNLSNQFGWWLKCRNSVLVDLWTYDTIQWYTPRNINMEPENTPLEKANHLLNHHFQVLVKISPDLLAGPSNTSSFSATKLSTRLRFWRLPQPPGAVVVCWCHISCRDWSLVKATCTLAGRCLLYETKNICKRHPLEKHETLIGVKHSSTKKYQKIFKFVFVALC